MTLSVGLSFGTGLYGHDIGGFAPSFLSPSPELLVRWVQHGAWHTRFVVHSWKEVDTTLWMYDDVEMEDVPIGKIIRNAVTLRYQLAPTFYSLYVAHYYRRAWPVLKVSGFDLGLQSHVLMSFTLVDEAHAVVSLSRPAHACT